MMNYRQLIGTLALVASATFLLAASPASAAKADEVGRYEGPAGTLVLTKLVEDCDGMKKFFGVHSRMGPVQGCYVIVGERVLIEFSDGEVGFLPLDIFKLNAV
jgi:hypothetical protein